MRGRVTGEIGGAQQGPSGRDVRPDGLTQRAMPLEGEGAPQGLFPAWLRHRIPFLVCVSVLEYALRARCTRSIGDTGRALLPHGPPHASLVLRRSLLERHGIAIPQEQVPSARLTDVLKEVRWQGLQGLLAGSEVLRIRPRKTLQKIVRVNNPPLPIRHDGDPGHIRLGEMGTRPVRDAAPAPPAARQDRVGQITVEGRPIRRGGIEARLRMGEQAAQVQVKRTAREVVPLRLIEDHRTRQLLRGGTGGQGQAEPGQHAKESVQHRLSPFTGRGATPGASATSAASAAASPTRTVRAGASSSENSGYTAPAGHYRRGASTALRRGAGPGA